MGAGADEAAGGRLRRQYRLGRVLVSQDDVEERATALVRCLTQAGFDTLTCPPRRMPVTFERERPDIVLLTATTEDRGTVALCEWLRSRSSVPVMVVVARGARPDPVELLSTGADLVLPASVGERELVARVRVLLRRSPPKVLVDGSLQPYGGLSLERESGVLHVPSGALKLEGRELALMDMLLRSAPRVTSRSAVRDALHVDEGALDGLVRRLRERLEGAEGWRRIVAIRRVGFRLLEHRPRSAGTSTQAIEPTVLDLLDPDASSSSTMHDSSEPPGHMDEPAAC